MTAKIIVRTLFIFFAVFIQGPAKGGAILAHSAILACHGTGIILAKNREIA
jgi:hypothetical protein